MKEYRLEREQWIPSSAERVFDFFSRAENLAKITPPWLDFRMISPVPIHMHVGAKIEYTIRLLGVRVYWRTRIEAWDPPANFVDAQEQGPYAYWEHTHRFRVLGEGILMIDRVRYALPLGPLGRLTHALAVRSTLATIFDYRASAIRRLFPGA